MSRPALVVAVLVAAGCSDLHELAVVPALPACVPAGVNELQLSLLGDFPPAPAQVVAATASGAAHLTARRDTRVVQLEGLGASGLVAFGRSGPLALDKLGAAAVPIAYGPPDGLCATGRLNYARSGHSATLLPSGSVLIAGGVDSDGFPVPRLELFVPDAAAFQVVDAGGPTALDARAALGHAVVVVDGVALVTGGAPSASGEASGIAFEGVTRHLADGRLDGPARVLGGGPRAFHTASALPDGTVLITGGCTELQAGACVPGRVLGSTVIYRPSDGVFSDGPQLLHGRWGHQAIVRGDGTVLLVGGRDESGAPPAELIVPGNPRGIDARAVVGAAALLPTGAVLISGGTTGLTFDTAALWLSPDEEPLALAPMPQPRTGHTMTLLEDGATLIAGGGDGSTLQPALLIYDGRGRVSSLAARFQRRGHSATRLFDGTVLLAGGASGSATAEAALYLRSPLGPYASLPTLTLDSPDQPLLPRRPDRAVIAGGRLSFTATATSDGRPGELALVAGLSLSAFTLDVLVGRTGDAAAALVFAHRSEAAYDFVMLAPMQSVALYTVTVTTPGQVVVRPVAGCVGSVLDPSELPDDGTLAHLRLTWTGTQLTADDGHPLLSCSPTANVSRGAVGVAALSGTVSFSNLTVSR